MTHRLVSLAAPVLLAAVMILCPASASGLDKSLERDLRLFMLDGKFSEANELLEKDAELRDNPTFRVQLGDLALKHLQRREGKERRAGLRAARDHFAAARALDPSLIEVAGAALEAASELARWELEDKKPDAALAEATWAVLEGEKALEGAATLEGVEGIAELKLAISDCYVTRAEVSHKVEDFDQIVSDYGRAAELVEQAAAGSPQEHHMLSKSARALMGLAIFIHDNRPIDEETRDEEAIKKSIALAQKACEHEKAIEEQFTVHLLALRQAHRMKIEQDLGKPYMRALSPPVDGLDIEVPRAGGWKRQKIGKDIRDLQLLYQRQLEDDWDAVQITLNMWDFDARTDGPNWNNFEENVKTRFEAQKKKLTDVVSTKEPVQLGVPEEDDSKKKRKKKKKKSPHGEVWFFEVTGAGADGRQHRIGQWFFFENKKSKVSYQLRMMDWRRTLDLTDPDLVAFVESTIEKAMPPPDKKKR